VIFLIDKIGSNPANLISSVQPKSVTEIGASDLGKQFGAFLNDAVNNLNAQQKTVDQLNQSFVKGELSDVHQLTIASEKAAVGLELTVQVRNKVIEAYQEIMRTQL
jgi:flagellar hook-basal body complex protein FliE